MTGRVLVGAALLTGTAMGAAPARAQVSLEPEIALQSSYLWRGLSYGSGASLQPAAVARFTTPRLELLLGGWSQIELSDGTLRNTRVSEYQTWAEAAVSVRAVSLLAGALVAIERVPDEAAAITPELYISASLAAPLAPTVTAYYDLSEVRGAFYELSLAHTVELRDDLALELSLQSGISRGQAGEDEYYARDGFTHIDAGAALAFRVGSVAVLPGIHWVRGFDPATREAVSGASRVWAGITFALPLAGRTP